MVKSLVCILSVNRYRKNGVFDCREEFLIEAVKMRN